MKTRGRPYLATFIALVLLIPALGVSGDSLPDSYALPGETVFPEGVATLPGPNYFYVSSTDDGTIFRGQLHEPEAEVFLPGGQDDRTAAAGLAVDPERNILFVSGAATGMVWAYDLRSRELVGIGANDYEQTFINDVTVTPDGAAYFTDSMQPVIYRLSGAGSDEATFEEWLELDGTAIEYQEGFNLNGIVASADGAYLIAVQSNTGKLFRITTGDEADAVEIDLGGATVPAGDGLVLRGQTLSVVQNQLGQITTVKLSGDYTSGELWSVYVNPAFMTPTTAAVLGDRLLVVNAQFGARGGTPVLPFSVSSVPVWKLTRSGLQ